MKSHHQDEMADPGLGYRRLDEMGFDPPDVDGSFGGAMTV